jgi:hypothetical protein
MTNTQIIDNGRKPLLIAPPKSVETHSHIFGPADRYPHVAGRKPHVEASLEQYEALLARLGFERGVIVQPSLYSTDNTITLESIAAMGLHRARAALRLPPGTYPPKSCSAFTTPAFAATDSISSSMISRGMIWRQWQR